MNIEDKIIAITGGASGMGAATARRFAGLGAKVILLDTNRTLAEELAAELGGVALECDVTDSACIEAAFATAEAEFGGLHVVVNCAGIAPAALIAGKNGPMPLDDFNRVIQINLIGTFNVMRLAAAVMTRQEPVNDDAERGVIINTASVAAFEGQIGQAAYSASKGGVVALTLPAARELSRFGIRVMTIAPGLIETPMMAGLPEKVQESLSATVPFPKRLGKAEEFAQLAQHIVENPYLNGSVIRLDASLRMAEK